jgi:hypothetical protein
MSELKTTVLPLSHMELKLWLARCLPIVCEMAFEGIVIDGSEDPQDIMFALQERLGLDEADDPWRAVLKELSL